jgi:hypothetical protein
MQACELVELAAVVALHAPVLEHLLGLPKPGLDAYWVASKCRLDRWSRELKRLSGEAADATHRSRCGGVCLAAAIEEVLTGEVLTRVWTAALCLHDRLRDCEASEPIARSVLLGHMEARHRALSILVRGSGLDEKERLRLNQLRTRAERWIDLLIGELARDRHFQIVAEFAIDPRRAKEFAQEFARQARKPGQDALRPLLLGSLRASFYEGLYYSPNADLNARIAAAVLACFPPETLDPQSLPQSLWMARIAKIANDAQGLLDELLGPKQMSQV